MNNELINYLYYLNQITSITGDFLNWISSNSPLNVIAHESVLLLHDHWYWCCCWVSSSYMYIIVCDKKPTYQPLTTIILALQSPWMCACIIYSKFKDNKDFFSMRIGVVLSKKYRLTYYACFSHIFSIALEKHNIMLGKYYAMKIST